MAELNELAVIEKKTLGDIAEAIRTKGGATGPMKPGDMADAIAALPSGGGVPVSFFDRTITGVLNLTNAAATTVTQRQFENRTGLTEIIAPNLTLNNYACNGCTGLVKCTFRGSNNNATNFAGCSALNDVTFTGIGSQIIVGYAALLGSVPTTCVFHCTDRDVKYIDGAWVSVERS